jgi:predicted ATPase/DNA-binding SARP family transcriptional activator
MPLAIRLLGEPSMTFDGKPWKWSAPPRCLPLLALLALARNGAPTRASLAATMWPDEIDSDARTNLRRHLHRLARALPQIEGVEWIVGDDRCIGWNDEAPAWIDVRAFEDARTDPRRRAEAVELYRGDLLEGYYDEYVLEERERLRNLYINDLAELIRDARARRDFPAAIGFAENLLGVDEWREDALREWISAKYESGDRSGALAGYERFARRLQEEFSSNPMPETTALRDAIRAGIPLPEDPERALEQHPVESGQASWKLPLVGRSAELEKLRAAWSRAARKSGGVAFVSGEAGIGKSRLTGELVALVRDQGGQALIGVSSNPEGEPYQAIVTALRSGLARIAQLNVEEPWLASLAQAIPEIRSLRPELRDVEVASDERARERLFEAFVRVLEYLGRMRPLCLVLEDVHWAGPATVDLLATLARRVGTLSVLVVATYRNEESAEAVRDLRAKLVAERRAIAVPLERLTPEEVGTVVGNALPETGNGEIAGAIAQLSEGNPLFVLQLLEGYRETGEIPDASSALHTVGDAIAVRARRLDAGVRSVAETAAAIGQTFRADIVADIGGWDENVVLDAIGELIDRALVRESGSGALEYAFTHALVAVSFYETSDPTARTARHRRAAQVLQRLGREDRADLAAIARHWNRAGEATRAATWYIQAARSALAVHAREEAVTHSYASYALANDDATRFEALEIAARAQIRAGDLFRWHGDLNRLESVAERLGLDEQFTTLKLRERYAAQIVDFDLERRTVGAMYELAERSRNPLHRAEAHYARGFLEGSLANLDEAIEVLREGLSLAATLADDELVARMRHQMIAMLARRGDVVEARAELALQRNLVERQGVPIELRLSLLSPESALASMLEDGPWLERIGREMLEIARKVGDVYLEARAHATIAHGAFMQHNFAVIRSNYDRAIDLFKIVGEMRAVRVTYINRSELELRVGRVDEAMRWLDKSILEGDQLAGNDGLAAYGVNRVEALLLLGRAEEARKEAAEAHRLSLESDEKRFVDQTLTVLGVAETLTGDVDKGLAHLREALEGARMREAWADVGNDLCYLVETTVAANRPSEAATYAHDLERLFSEHLDVAMHPTRYCWCLSQFALATGDEAGSNAWIARGLELLDADLGRFSESADVAAYSALPFNRGLLDRRAKEAQPRSRQRSMNSQSSP